MQFSMNLIISEGLSGVLGNKGTLNWQNIEGNKGTLANFWEQGDKIRKITVRKHSERVWEHGNIGQFWKGTREQGPPWETLISIVFSHHSTLIDFYNIIDHLYVLKLSVPKVMF